MAEPVYTSSQSDAMQDCLRRLEGPYCTDQEMLHAVRDVLRTMLTGAIALHPVVSPAIPVGMPGHPDYDLPTHSHGGTQSTLADARLGADAQAPGEADAIMERERQAAMTLETARRAQEQGVRDAVVHEQEAREALAREANERRAETQRQAVREREEREKQEQDAATRAKQQTLQPTQREAQMRAADADASDKAAREKKPEPPQDPTRPRH